MVRHRLRGVALAQAQGVPPRTRAPDPGASGLALGLVWACPARVRRGRPGRVRDMGADRHTTRPWLGRVKS